MSDLILRAITTTDRVPLDDDWSEVEQPTESKPEPKPARRVNYAAKLAKALAELRRIEQRREQLMALDQAESQVLSELLNECSSIPSYNKDGSLDEFKKTYRAHVVAAMEAASKTQWLRDYIGGVARQRSVNAGSGHVVAILKGEFPELKTIFADAICGKAAQLKADADRIAKDEQKRLDDVYGAGEYEASETQVVKRAQVNCEYIDTMVKRFQSEPVESLYLDVVRYLLR